MENLPFVLWLVLFPITCGITDRFFILNSKDFKVWEKYRPTPKMYVLMQVVLFVFYTLITVHLFNP